MSTVITGASGHLGRLVVDQLLAVGTPPAQIMDTGRDAGKLTDLAQNGVPVRRADFADPITLDDAFAGAEAMLLVSTTTVGERFDNARNPIDAAARAGVPQIAYTSIVNAVQPGRVYGTPTPSRISARSVIVYVPLLRRSLTCLLLTLSPSCAVPVSGGMVVVVPAELLASPLKSGRDLGDGDRSALVIGGTGKIRSGGAVVFCKVVAVAEAQVKRDGQVRAKGSPVHHATLGPLEEKAGPGAAGGIAGQAPLGARFVKGQRERLLARAFMIRVIVLMTLMPEARIGDVIAALAGDLALVPWARPWRPASARAAGDWRNALGPVPWRSCVTWCWDRPGGSTRGRAVPGP